MSTSLALVAAVGWALSDFLGGHAARKVGSIKLTFSMQVWVLVLVLPVAMVLGGDPTASDWILGASGGCVNAIAFVLLMEGMRRRSMGAVVPSSAVAGALLPVIVGIASGDALTLIAFTGIVAAVVGAGFASSEAGGTHSVRRKLDPVALAFGVGSGVGFGLMFVLLSETHENAGLWPVIAMRASIPFMIVVAWMNRVSLAADVEVIKRSFLAAASAAIGISSFSIAARAGPLSIVTAIASTSPAGTVAIARFLAHEPTSRLQLSGAVLAVIGVILMTLP